MLAVSINKGQEASVPAMRTALRGLRSVFVFDRTDARFPFQSSTETAVWSTGWHGFLAGRMRDLGLLVADSKGFGDEDVLFLDGDKVPSGDLSELERMPADCVLLGTGATDPREWMHGTGEVERHLLADIWNGFYSCGLFIRRHAIEKVRQLNGGRLFHPAFDGMYGEEDRYLGDCLCVLGMKVWHTDRITLAGTLGLKTGREEQLGNNMIKRMNMRDRLYERFGRLGGYYDAD